MTPELSPAELRELHDRVMLTDLTSRYSYLLDYCPTRTRELAELFIPDATFELPNQGVVYRGREQIFEALRKVHSVKRHLHHFTSNLVIDLAGDAAFGHLHYNEFLLLPGKVHNYSQGHYEDEYVRADGRRWRFKRRRVFIPEEAYKLMTSPELVNSGLAVVQTFSSKG